MIKVSRIFLLSLLCMNFCIPVMAKKPMTNKVPQSLSYKFGRMVKIFVGIVACYAIKAPASVIANNARIIDDPDTIRARFPEFGHLNNEQAQTAFLMAQGPWLLSVYGTLGAGLWCTIEGGYELIKSIVQSVQSATNDSDEDDDEETDENND